MGLIATFLLVLAALSSVSVSISSSSSSSRVPFWTQFPLRLLQFPLKNDTSSRHLPYSLAFKNKNDIKEEAVEEVVAEEAKLNELCLYDPLVISWRVPSSINGESLQSHPEKCSIAFTLSAGSQQHMRRLVISSPILHQEGANVNKSNEDASNFNTSPLHCLLDKDFCNLLIREVKVDSSFVEIGGDTTRKVVVLFSHETNEPDVSSSEALQDILEFSPPFDESFGPVSAEWITPKSLHITANDEYIDSLIEASNLGNAKIEIRKYTVSSLHESESVSLFPSSSKLENSYSGEFNLRFSLQGQYKLFVINDNSKKVLSSVHDILVKPCGDTVVPSRMKSQARFVNNGEEKDPPRPLLRHAGVLAISGKTPVLIPQSILPDHQSTGNGSFSVSFWIRLMDLPRGYFRAFFYKGDGQSPNRSPSAWLLPTSNRLALRTTTITDPDLGADTTLSIPVDQWAHMCFVFDNSTFNNDGSGFQLLSYLNGNLDISITYSTQVLPNDANMQFFHDISHQGPRAFVADFVVWDSALTEDQIKGLATDFSSSNYTRWTRSVDVALELFARSDDSRDFAESEVEEKDLLALDTDFDLLSLITDDVTPASSMPLEHILREISVAIENCHPPSVRLDLYAEAASFGHIESLYHWAMLIGFGSENSVSHCGIEHFDSSSFNHKYSAGIEPVDAIFEKEEYNTNDWRDIENLSIPDQVKSAFALLIAAQEGFSLAFVPLSTMLSTGVGLVPILSDFEDLHFSGKVNRRILAHILQHIPLPSNMSTIKLDSAHCKDRDALHCLSSSAFHGVFIDSSLEEFVPLPLVFRLSRLFRKNIKPLAPSSTSLHSPHTIESKIRHSVFDWQSTPSSANDITQVATGILFLAALDDHADAFIALQKRYEFGLGGLETNIEVSSFYSKVASVTSSNEFFKVGAQPIMENDRLSDDTEVSVLKGNTGKDDDIVQTYLIQAAEGDVGSMLALGEMNYFGTRGLARNQARALEFYNQAAALGNAGGMCGAAGMYIKGEGTEKNITKAVELYDAAAAQGSVRALNGLGFFYFFGDSDTPANHTKAFRYFLAATEQQDGDSDSWFNAGYCTEHGLGTEADPAKAATFYQHAAKRFGHFGSIVAMGNMHYEGKGVSRSVKESVYYFDVANDIGPWMGWLRRGFDQFAQNEKGVLPVQSDVGAYSRAVMCYLHAGELGHFEVSQSNAAYLIQRKLSGKALQYLTGNNLLESSYLLAQSPFDGSIDSKAISQEHADMSNVIADRLLIRELALSSSRGNANSACSLGALILSGRTGGEASTESEAVVDSPEDLMDVVVKRFDLQYSIQNYLPTKYKAADDNALTRVSSSNGKAALLWFSKASAMNSAMGSFYAGLLYHFGIGGVERNLLRAHRYYSSAIDNTVDPLHPTLKLWAQAMQWMIGNGDDETSWDWMGQALNSVAEWAAKKALT